MGRTGTLSLLGHQVFKCIHVDRQPLLPCHQLRQVQREAIGVIELKGIVAGNCFVRCILGCIGKDFDAPVKRAIETFLFAGQNGGNKVSAFFDFGKGVAHLLNEDR